MKAVILGEFRCDQKQLLDPGQFSFKLRGYEEADFLVSGIDPGLDLSAVIDPRKSLDEVQGEKLLEGKLDATYYCFSEKLD